MTSRTLPRAEWPRLGGSTIADAAVVLPPDARVVVVEDAAGAIVAHAAAIRYAHLEGVWVSPAHQKGVAFGRLLDEVRQIAHVWDARAIWTGVVSDDWRRLVMHLGGRRIVGDPYAFPARGPLCRG
jgi:hypothetical protein